MEDGAQSLESQPCSPWLTDGHSPYKSSLQQAFLGLHPHSPVKGMKRNFKHSLVSGLTGVHPMQRSKYPVDLEADHSSPSNPGALVLFRKCFQLFLEAALNHEEKWGINAAESMKLHLILGENLTPLLGVLALQQCDPPPSTNWIQFVKLSVDSLEELHTVPWSECSYGCFQPEGHLEHTTCLLR